jgi:hypothetical protein
MSELSDDVISKGWHWSYGWLRRPEMDVSHAGYVYEDGDGTLMIFKDYSRRRAVYLECCRDSKSGELYLKVGKQPTNPCGFKMKRPPKSRK